jgi:hypothetical protein
VGVEPTDDGVTRRPPVLKTGTITGPHALPRLSYPNIAFQQLWFGSALGNEFIEVPAPVLRELLFQFTPIGITFRDEVTEGLVNVCETCEARKNCSFDRTTKLLQT